MKINPFTARTMAQYAPPTVSKSIHPKTSTSQMKLQGIKQRRDRLTGAAAYYKD